MRPILVLMSSKPVLVFAAVSYGTEVVVIIALKQLYGVGVVGNEKIEGEPRLIGCLGLEEQPLPPGRVASFADADGETFIAFGGQFRQSGSAPQVVPEMKDFGRGDLGIRGRRGGRAAGGFSL